MVVSKVVPRGKWSYSSLGVNLSWSCTRLKTRRILYDLVCTIMKWVYSKCTTHHWWKTYLNISLISPHFEDWLSFLMFCLQGLLRIVPISHIVVMSDDRYKHYSHGTMTTKYPGKFNRKSDGPFCLISRSAKKYQTKDTLAHSRL